MTTAYLSFLLHGTLEEFPFIIQLVLVLHLSDLHPRYFLFILINVLIYKTFFIQIDITLGSGFVKHILQCKQSHSIALFTKPKFNERKFQDSVQYLQNYNIRKVGYQTLIYCIAT